MNAITPIQSAPAQHDLATRAMIVSLKISQWSGRRFDRKVSGEVTQQHGAASDAGNFNKALLPKDSLAGIASVVGESRTGFAARTLPWLDDGARIMAASAFMPHSTWVRGQQAKFDKAVADFISRYPDHVNDARARLGSMFDTNDYPLPSDLAGKFGMTMLVLPVPSAADFRVAMSENQAASIRADIEARVSEAAASAQRSVYERIAEQLERMADKLAAYKPALRSGDKTEGVFRDSLVENVRDLVNMLPGLNITGDPALIELGGKLARLAYHNAETLRSSDSKRLETEAEARRILDSIQGFLA
jgi:hypothetical protein